MAFQSYYNLFHFKDPLLTTLSIAFLVQTSLGSTAGITAQSLLAAIESIHSARQKHRHGYPI